MQHERDHVGVEALPDAGTGGVPRTSDCVTCAATVPATRPDGSASVISVGVTVRAPAPRRRSHQRCGCDQPALGSIASARNCARAARRSRLGRSRWGPRLAIGVIVSITAGGRARRAISGAQHRQRRRWHRIVGFDQHARWPGVIREHVIDLQKEDQKFRSSSKVELIGVTRTRSGWGPRDRR